MEYYFDKDKERDIFLSLSNHHSYNPLANSTYRNIYKYKLLKNKGMKSLGQNFLYDEGILTRIAKSAIPIDRNCSILEIGPGPCGLTRAIMSNFQNELICIEKDAHFKSLHDDILRNTTRNIKFIYTDALQYDLKNFERVVIISNLPYNIGTVLLVRFLTKYIKQIEKMVLLFQKEVAERICAKYNTKQYGTISILTQLLCETELLFDIANKDFLPPPKVTSSVLLLTPKAYVFDDISISDFSKFVQTCFQFRRKMIHSTLKKLYPLTDVERVLSQVGISANQRPESIAPSEYLQIFVKLTEQI